MAHEEAEERVLLLSIRPRFTDALVSGEKSVELRRSRMQAAPGCQVLLYSSSPVKAVVATAVLERIDCREPEDLWSRSGPGTAVTKAEFDAYFAGTERAYGLHLRNIATLSAPVSLRDLRNGLGVEPPQSFRYLSRAQVDCLLPEVAQSGAPAPGGRSWESLADLALVRPLFRTLAALAAAARVRPGAPTQSRPVQLGRRAAVSSAARSAPDTSVLPLLTRRPDHLGQRDVASHRPPASSTGRR